MSSPVGSMLMDDRGDESGYASGASENQLSLKDMDIIRSLDSRSFGFLDLTPASAKDSLRNFSPSQNTGGAVSSSSQSTGSDFVSREFIKKGIAVLQSQLSSCSEATKPTIFCQIGHLHLLLEEYPEALSAYQNYSHLCSVSSLNTSFLYGVALVYFAYGKYDWSLSAFLKVLSLATDFARLSEVHIRMAMMYKDKGDCNKAMEHFSQAYTSAGPCSMSRLEVQFHIGHLYYLRGEYSHAKHCFESILASKNVPNLVKALALRQLGWLYYTIPRIAARSENPHTKAIELLKLAVGANPACSQAWYFLGRCHADQGQFKEAFMAYRQSISKLEKQPDTWCAIGILYQQMGQARDSLQAYITAVYFDITHTATWTDLGLLYESCGHLIDSLLCYKNGLISLEKKPNRASKKDNVTDVLASRLTFVEQHIQQTGGLAVYSSQPRSVLPSIQEAWTTLVPHHFKLKYPINELPIFHLPLSSFPSVPTSPLLSPGLGRVLNNKKYKVTKSKDPIILRNISEGWIGNSAHHIPSPQATPYGHAPFIQPKSEFGFAEDYTSQLDLAPPPSIEGQAYHHMQQNSAHYYYNGGSHDQSISSSYIDPELPPSMAQQDSLQTIIYEPNPVPSTALAGGTAPPSSCSPTPMSLGGSSPLPLPQDLSSVLPLPLECNYLDRYVGNEDATAGNLLGLVPSTGTQTEEQFDQNVTTLLGKRSQQNDDLNFQVKLPRVVTTSSTWASDIGRTHRPSSLSLTSSSYSQTHSDRPHSHTATGLSLGSGHLSDTSSGVSSSGMKFSTSSNLSSPSSSPCLVSSPFSYPSPRLRVTAVMTPIPEPHPGLGSEGEYMRANPLLPPSPPSPEPSLDLHPEVPVYTVQTYDELDLHNFCTTPDLPICIIKGLPEATDFDLSLFTTDNLMAYHGDHDVEVREQLLQASDKNYDPLGKKQVWKCESSRSSTTVKEYGEYQKEILKNHPKPKYDTLPRKMLKFGTNCDLSDSNKWSQQLDEIKKLPKFLQVDCPQANVLNHVGHTVLGMNSVQLYMKVPGCRTPGHQENNNFCSVNINIGPGDCEWFAVPNKYWGVIHDLCEKHKLSFLVGSWWPILEELEKHQVPVYQFTQYKGEVVWINPGTVHWVQANTCCNNIAWNVGPLSAHQLRMSWERYQWNKVLKVRSIVPMMTVTWNLAKGVKVTDPNMFQQISNLLINSYKQCEQLIHLLDSRNVPITWHGHMEGEPTPTCTTCFEEVFNILFVSTNKKGDHLVYCHKCVQHLQTKNKKQTFTVLQQYTLTELKRILDDFHCSASP